MPYKGLRGGQYRVLSNQDIERIHGTALQVLERVGVKIADGDVRDLLGEHGAQVDHNKHIVRFPAKLVEWGLEKVPNKVTLYGREEKHTLELEDKRVYLGTGGAAVRVLDMDTNKVRASTLEDLADLARLVDALENIHFFLRPVVAQDVAKEKLDVNKYYACLANTTKHVMANAYTVEGAHEVIELASMIAGSREALIAKPFISFTAAWTISPLKYATETVQVLREIVRAGLPVALSSAPLTGATAPASLAGLLALVHAEELSGIVLTQAIKEGAPILYGPVPGAAYMRSMAFMGGSVETAMMNAATAQLAQYIEVPIYGDAGITESKLPDFQAGYEKATTIMMAALAGSNFIHHAAGILDSLLTVAPEQYVLDNEVCGVAMRALQGILVDEESLALEVIEAVGPGNNFLVQRHTVNVSKSDEYFMPQVADRDLRSDWEAAGSLDARSKAQEITRNILKEHRPQTIPEHVDEAIRKRFDILLDREGGKIHAS